MALMWDKEIRFTDSDQKRGRRIFLYGDTGSGKTHFLGTCPKPFVIDTDKGLLTLDKMHIPYVTVNYSESRAYSIVRDIHMRFKDSSAPMDQYDTLALDSGSAFSDILFASIMSSKGKDPKKDKADYDVWGAILGCMNELVQISKDIPVGKNIVWTAGVQFEKNELTGEIRALPEFLGSFRDKVAKHFDWVLQLELEPRGTYAAYTRRHGIYLGKVRGDVPTKIENPTYEKLYGNGEKNK